MGNSVAQNISGSTIGAVSAAGDESIATSVGPVSASGAVSREAFKTQLGDANIALARDQDLLDEVDKRLYEVLHQFLRITREIEVEQKNLGQIQSQMKATLDDLAAKQFGDEVKPAMFGKAVEFIKVLASSPITAELAKLAVFGPGVPA